jgi:hypothetical protein
MAIASMRRVKVYRKQLSMMRPDPLGNFRILFCPDNVPFWPAFTELNDSIPSTMLQTLVHKCSCFYVLKTWCSNEVLVCFQVWNMVVGALSYKHPTPGAKRRKRPSRLPKTLKSPKTTLLLNGYFCCWSVVICNVVCLFVVKVLFGSLDLGTMPSTEPTECRHQQCTNQELHP